MARKRKMMAGQRPGVGLLLLLVLLGGSLATWTLTQNIGQPFGGFLTFYAPLADVWNIDRQTPPWWSGLAQSPLRYGDGLRRLDGQPYGVEQGDIYAAVQARGDETVSLTVERQGQALDLAVPVVPFTLAHFFDIKLSRLLTGLAFWLLALFVYRARPEETLNRIFAITAGLEAASQWFSPPSLFLHTTLIIKALDLLLFALVIPFAAAGVIHLALLIFQPSRFYHPLTLTLLYGLTSLVAILYAASRLLFWQAGYSAGVAWLDSAGYHGFWSLRLAGISIFLIRFLWFLFSSEATTRQRRQAQLLLAGFLLASPYLIPLTRLALWGGSDGFFWRSVDLRFLLLAIPTFTAVAIVRYQTVSIQTPLFLTVPLLALSGLIASVGTAVWRETADSDYITPLLVAVVMVLIASLIWATQVRWRGFFGRLLNWHKQSYDAVGRFGRQLAGQTNMTALPTQIAAALVSELQLEQAAVWLWDRQKNVFRLAGQAGVWGDHLPDVLPVGKEERLAFDRPLRLDGPERPPSAWCAELYGQTAVILPLQAPDRMIGFLALGKRWDEEIFNERDLTIAELIAQQSALFLLAAMQIDELRQIPQLVDEAQERERTKIAHEMHDTIQQFLGRLPFFLEISRMAAWNNPHQADQILQQCVADVEEAARTVRQIRQDLTKDWLKDGVIQPLTELIDRFQVRTGLTAHLQISTTVDSQLTLAARHALYRVVQQALDNVAQHAQAQNVEVVVVYQNGRLIFHISDDGCGFSDEQRMQAQARGSFGLRSMTARIQNLGGQLQIESGPRSGTRISGWLPGKQ
jgi:signal transduction histidine kinase